MEIYLDNAATTKIHPQVLNTYIDATQRYWGNCSNLTHSFGKAARNELEKARYQIGQLLGVAPKGIIFTSGATEANNLAIRGITCLQKGRCSMVTSSIEHPCVEESTRFLLNRGIRVLKLKTLPNGQIDLNHLQQLLRKNSPKLISVMFVNNETGVIQPIKEIIQLARSAGTLVHTDAVQAIGKIPIEELKQVDMFSISAHKINGPKGIGCLYVNPDLKISPLLVGGGQESGIRSGTTPVPTVLAFKTALSLAIRDTEWHDKIKPAMKLLEKQLGQIPGTRINGIEAPRNGLILNVSFPYKKLVINQLQNVAASAASACGCSHSKPSRVLLNMGLPELLAKNTLRLSAGRLNEPNEMLLAAKFIRLASSKSSQ